MEKRADAIYDSAILDESLLRMAQSMLESKGPQALLLYGIADFTVQKIKEAVNAGNMTIDFTGMPASPFVRGSKKNASD